MEYGVPFQYDNATFKIKGKGKKYGLIIVRSESDGEKIQKLLEHIEFCIDVFKEYALSEILEDDDEIRALVIDILPLDMKKVTANNTYDGIKLVGEPRMMYDWDGYRSVKIDRDIARSKAIKKKIGKTSNKSTAKSKAIKKKTMRKVK